MSRVAGWGGLIFVLLVAMTNLVQGAAGRPFGNPDQAGYLADYLTYYREGDAIPMLLGFVLPVIWIGLALFGAGILATLLAREWRQSREAWSVVGLIGIIMQNSTFPVVVALDIAQHRFVAEEGSLALGAHYVHEVLFGLNSLSLAIAMIGFSAAMLRSGAASKWLSRLGFLAAILLVVSKTSLGLDAAPALFDGLGLIGFLLWLVFVAAASVWLLKHPVENPEPAVGVKTVAVSP